MTFRTNECIQISKWGVWWSPFLASVGLLNICKVQNVAAHCSGQGNKIYISVIPRHRPFSSPSSTPQNEATMCSFNWEFFPVFTTQFLMLAVCNNGGRWSESIYHVSDLNVLIGTQSGEGLKEHFVCTCSLFWTMSSNLCTLQMFRTPIHGLMLQEKALIVLFDVNMSTQVDRRAQEGAYIVQHSLNEQLPFFCGNYQKGCPNMVIVMCPLHSTWLH